MCCDDVWMKPNWALFPLVRGWSPWGLGWEVSLHGSLFCLSIAGFILKNLKAWSSCSLPLCVEKESTIACVEIEGKFHLHYVIVSGCENVSCPILLLIERKRVIHVVRKYISIFEYCLYHPMFIFVKIIVSNKRIKNENYMVLWMRLHYLVFNE